MFDTTGFAALFGGTTGNDVFSMHLAAVLPGGQSHGEQSPLRIVQILLATPHPRLRVERTQWGTTVEITGGVSANQFRLMFGIPPKALRKTHGDVVNLRCVLNGRPAPMNAPLALLILRVMGTELDRLDH